MENPCISESPVGVHCNNTSCMRCKTILKQVWIILSKFIQTDNMLVVLEQPLFQFIGHRVPYSQSSGRPRRLQSAWTTELTPKVVLWTSEVLLNHKATGIFWSSPFAENSDRDVLFC